MEESAKTNLIRGEAFVQKYFSGKVIDIGAGQRFVVPNAEPFDKKHGDANTIDQCREPESYDCVHSSHCLANMHDPVDAIGRWWKLVKPGGHLIVIVPDEDLYEQGVWPSRFNPDHKATFRLDKSETSWSPCSFDLRSLVEGLPDAKLISAEVQDHHYDRSMLRLGPENDNGVFMRKLMMRLYTHLLKRNLLPIPLCCAELNRFFFQLGATVDQTVGPALAQIQVVAQKLSVVVSETGKKTKNVKSVRSASPSIPDPQFYTIPDQQFYSPVFSPWRGWGDFRPLFAKAHPYTLVSSDRCWILYSLAKQAAQLTGNFFELGVYRGGTAIILRQVLLGADLAKGSKKLHLFDTFEGMPETDPKRDIVKPGDFQDTDIETVMQTVGTDDFITYHKGYIPDTFTGLEEECVSLAHVDVDIYRSIIDSCAFIYPRLIASGIIVFDDYGFPTCPGARQAVDEFFADKPEVPLVLPTGQAIVIKCS